MEIRRFGGFGMEPWLAPMPVGHRSLVMATASSKCQKANGNFRCFETIKSPPCLFENMNFGRRMCLESDGGLGRRRQPLNGRRWQLLFAFLGPTGTNGGRGVVEGRQRGFFLLLSINNSFVRRQNVTVCHNHYLGFARSPMFVPMRLYCK